METAEQLASRFREVTLNGTWIANTNFKMALSDVTFKQATTKISNLNTIGVLTFHIHYYIAGLIEAFETGQLSIKDSFSFDMKSPFQQEDWQELKVGFFNDAERLAVLIADLPENILNETFIDIRYGTYRRNIEAMIEHSYYHLGQVIMLKKLIGSNIL